MMANSCPSTTFAAKSNVIMKFLSKFFLFYGVFLLSIIANGQVNEYNILPLTAQFAGYDGQFVFTSDTKVIATKDAGQQAAAQLLLNQLKSASGLNIALATTTKGKAVVFQAHKAQRCGSEGYVLKVDPNKITIEAETAKGYFYAVQTLFQLLPPQVFSSAKVENISWTVPACSILDRPRFSYRGFMLDVSRHFMPVPSIKKMLDLMAMQKMNTFHWHLTDDQGWRIEIKKYPKLTQVGSKRKQTLIGHYGENNPQQFDGKEYGGFYTQNEIKEVVKYAASRHITIIPEIEMPGHASAALTAYPELSCDATKKYEVQGNWGIFEDVYCPNEKTFTFLQDVLTEVFALFPGKYVHIGGDECPKEAWHRSAFCQELIKKNKLKDEDGLQSYFIKRIEKFANTKGRSIIGWDEILDGGLAPNAVVMSWRGEKGGIEAAKQKHNVVMSPNTYCYLDRYQAEPSKEPLAIGGYLPIEKVYAYEPVPSGLSDADKKYILGVQGNLWTEYITTTEQVEYMAFPRLTALAEIGWSPRGAKNFEDFTDRLKVHFKRLDFLKVNYAKSILDIRATTQLNSDGKLQVRLEKLDYDSKMYYTTNGKNPTTASTEYIMPITLEKTTSIKAITTAGSTFERTMYVHRAIGKPYQYSADLEEGHDLFKKLLTDGQVITSPRNTTDWVYTKKDLDVVIDLGELKTVTKVSANFLKNVLYNVFPPTAVEISLSKDGESYKDAINQSVDYNVEGPSMVMPVVADFKTARARYIRIKTKNTGPSPIENVEGKGQPTSLAIDEIVVE